MDIVRAILKPGPIERTDEMNLTIIPGARRDGRRPKLMPDSEGKILRAEHDALLDNDEIVTFLVYQRRISIAAIKKLWLGWRASVKRVVVPYMLPRGLVSGRGQVGRVFQRDLWMPPRYRRANSPKVLPEATEEDEWLSRWLWFGDIELLDGADWAVLTEGSMDGAAVVSAGLPAIAAPSATTWRESWTEELIALGITTLYVTPDCDEEGERFGELVSEAFEDSVVEVIVVDLGLGDKQDVTDFLRKTKMSFTRGGDELRKLLEVS
jgi:hypothetical protein